MASARRRIHAGSSRSEGGSQSTTRAVPSATSFRSAGARSFQVLRVRSGAASHSTVAAPRRIGSRMSSSAAAITSAFDARGGLSRRPSSATTGSPPRAIVRAALRIASADAALACSRRRRHGAGAGPSWRSTMRSIACSLSQPSAPPTMNRRNASDPPRAPSSVAARRGFSAANEAANEPRRAAIGQES